MSFEVRYVKVVNKAAFEASISVIVVAFEEGALAPTYLLGTIADHDDRVFKLTDLPALHSGAEFTLKVEADEGGEATDTAVLLFDKSSSLQADYTVSGHRSDPVVEFVRVSEHE